MPPTAVENEMVSQKQLPIKEEDTVQEAPKLESKKADQKPASKSSQAKKPARAGQKRARAEAKPQGEKVSVKRERKVFELPGQTRDTPDEVS